MHPAAPTRARSGRPLRAALHQAQLAHTVKGGASAKRKRNQARWALDPRARPCAQHACLRTAMPRGRRRWTGSRPAGPREPTGS